jgi:hypothetical protein
MVFDQELNMAEVYALVCPDTGDYRYIGMTRYRSLHRFQSHIGPDALGPVRDWVNALRAAEKRPILRVIATDLTEVEARNLERNLIRRTQNLLNRVGRGKKETKPKRKYERKKNAAARKWVRTLAVQARHMPVRIGGLDTLSWWKHKRKLDGLQTP